MPVSSTKPIVLFITALQFYPPQGGEKLHAYNIIDSLSRHFDVTVLAPPQSNCPLDGQVRAWYSLASEGQQSFREQMQQLPFGVLPRLAWRRQIATLCQELRPDVVWFSYGHWGQYAALARAAGAKTIMRTHNVQSALTRQVLSLRPLSRWHLYYAVRYLLEAWHERTLFRRFDLVLSVSETDRRYHACWVGEAKSLCVPNYLDESRYQLSTPVARDPNLVVMTGNFGAFQNQQGALWLSELWPTVRQVCPDTRLLLVGHVPAYLRRSLEAQPGVQCTGTVPTVVPYLRQAAVGVIPLHHGSGMRIKILEALACELPMVSTTLGAEGVAMTDGTDVLLADNPAAFTRAVINLLGSATLRQRLAQNGLAILRREYSMAVNTERLQKIVASLAEEKV